MQALDLLTITGVAIEFGGKLPWNVQGGLDGLALLLRSAPEDLQVLPSKRKRLSNTIAMTNRSRQGVLHARFCVWTGPLVSAT